MEHIHESQETRIVASVHDCISVETPKDEAENVRQIMERVMTTDAVNDFRVPLQVDFE